MLYVMSLPLLVACFIMEFLEHQYGESFDEFELLMILRTPTEAWLCRIAGWPTLAFAACTYERRKGLSLQSRRGRKS